MQSYIRKNKATKSDGAVNPRASRQLPVGELVQAYQTGDRGWLAKDESETRREDILQKSTGGQPPVNEIIQAFKARFDRLPAQAGGDDSMYRKTSLTAVGTGVIELRKLPQEQIRAMVNLLLNRDVLKDVATGHYPEIKDVADAVRYIKFSNDFISFFESDFDENKSDIILVLYEEVEKRFETGHHATERELLERRLRLFYADPGNIVANTYEEGELEPSLWADMRAFASNLAMAFLMYGERFTLTTGGHDIHPLRDTLVGFYGATFGGGSRIVFSVVMGEDNRIIIHVPSISTQHDYGPGVVNKAAKVPKSRLNGHL